MDYCEIAPAQPLAEVIRCYWFLSGTKGEMAEDPALPDGSAELIFSLADPFVAVGSGGRERMQPAVFLAGQITGPFHVRPTGRVDLVGVRLEAGGSTWLERNIRLLTDDFCDVSDRFDGALIRVHRQLATAGTAEARAAVLDESLVPLVANGPLPDWRVREAVRAIRANFGSVDLGAIADTLRTSPRTLQRLFNDEVGITPKLFVRIVRFQRVFSRWRDDPSSLSRVAAECGYFDHAHLVRDFRELAGLTPARFLPNQPEFTRFFTE